MAGRPRPQPHSSSAPTRRRERWLVILGIALHAVYMLSIFDIYFKSPIVHGMAPVPPRLSAPPAKRLVLLVADGLRADKFFEPDEGRYRAPFLRGVIEEKGRWGVGHARPPRSRPGHVAIIAGFYEDPSAVTKGWKANPVEFDSVFNQSRHTISFGSPDIVPIFCSSLPHSTWGSYPHEYEDFATGTLIADASFLDHWSFDQFEGLLNSEIFSELGETFAQGPIRSFQKTEDLTKWGHEEARRVACAARTLARGPTLGPGGPALTLACLSFASRNPDLRRCEAFTGAPREIPLGITEIASAPLWRIHLRRTLHP
ncbi:hypothetical protein QYE76_023231 [Lolium multiflorum]|uniref:GPI ethanolamine phosphate transferase 1 n=1 Tax=Lolium multiflorum TaxID=4521 RepID=A0AAD8RE28_LOLMU|nr:hypothetical protein QYE76_023231 [Lolium multiflorum]